MRAGTHTLSKKLTILLRYNIRATTETGKWATCKELATAAGAREELMEHIIKNECKGTRPRFLYECGGPSTPSLCQAYAKQAKGTVGHQWWPTTNGNNNDLDNDNEHNPSSKRSRTDATREHAAPSIPDSTTQCPTVWHTEYGYEDERASTKPDEKLFIKRIGNLGGEPHPVKVDSDDDDWGPGWGPKPSHWAPSPVVARQCCKAIRRSSSVKRYVGAKSEAGSPRVPGVPECHARTPGVLTWLSCVAFWRSCVAFWNATQECLMACLRGVLAFLRCVLKRFSTS